MHIIYCLIFLTILAIIIVITTIYVDIQNTYHHTLRVINIFDNRIPLTEETGKKYKCYTFYSEKYKSAYDLMLKTLKDDFEMKPIVIEQDEMQKCFEKTPKHFYDYRWRGCDIKIRLVIDSIKQNMGDYILFIDSDLVFIKPIAPILDYYLENDYDLVLTESCFINIAKKYCITTGENIGIMFIKCSEKTLAFFEGVRDNILRNGWDEGAVKISLKDMTLNHATFPAYLVSTQFAYNPESHVVKVIGSYIGLNKNEAQKLILQEVNSAS